MFTSYLDNRIRVGLYPATKAHTAFNIPQDRYATVTKSVTWRSLFIFFPISVILFTKGAIMSRLDLYFLGSPRVYLDRATVEINRRKVLALLAYLAVTAQRHSRDELAELLYGKQDREHAQANLRQTLSLLRNAIGKDCRSPH